MHDLKDGVVKFKKSDFESHKELFNKLSQEQKPHTLFIGCSDSRVVPSLITHTLPGELFIVRNIANIVPPYRETEEWVATTSAIEYAVQMLDVENIVVCGHSNCGGCTSLFEEQSKLDKVPHVKKWLELAKPVRDKVLKKTKEENIDRMEWMAEQINVVEQIKHLLTYPFIADKYIDGKIKILGWYYIIETGEVYNYNKDTGFFEVMK